MIYVLQHHGAVAEILTSSKIILKSNSTLKRFCKQYVIAIHKQEKAYKTVQNDKYLQDEYNINAIGNTALSTGGEECHLH